MEEIGKEKSRPLLKKVGLGTARFQSRHSECKWTRGSSIHSGTHLKDTKATGTCCSNATETQVLSTMKLRVWRHLWNPRVGVWGGGQLGPCISSVARREHRAHVAHPRKPPAGRGPYLEAKVCAEVNEMQRKASTQGKEQEQQVQRTCGR